MGSRRASSSPITLPPVIPEERSALPAMNAVSTKRSYHQHHQGATGGGHEQIRDGSKRSRTGNRSSRKEKSNVSNDEETAYAPFPHPNYGWHGAGVEPHSMNHHYHHHPSSSHRYYMGYHHHPSHYPHHYGAPPADRSTSPIEKHLVNSAPDLGMTATGNLPPPYPQGSNYYKRSDGGFNSRHQGHSHPSMNEDAPLYARPPHPHMYEYPAYPYPYWYDHNGYMESSLSENSSSSSTEVASIPGSEHFYGKIPSPSPEIRHASKIKNSPPIFPFDGRKEGKRNINLQDSVSSVESSDKVEHRLTLPTVPTDMSKSASENLPRLALPEDRLILSEALCIVRENLEVFTATTADINAPAPGRKNIVSLGQVGIRCIHCVNCKSRVKRAQCYPSNISR